MGPQPYWNKKNGLVDTAARDAINNHLLSNVKLPREDIKCIIRETVTNKWELQWDMTQANKLCNIKNDVRPYRVSARKNRQWERTLTRVRIGHSKVTHGFVMDGGHPPFCEVCLVPLTMLHIVAEYPTFSDDECWLLV